MTMSDHEAFEAIKAHHRQLGDAVAQRVAALTDGFAGGRGYELARAELVTFLVDEVLPHAAAEELTIYPEAAKRAELTATVVAMVAEHRELASLVETIAGAPTGEDAVAASRLLATLFASHVATENEVLLPPLVADESVVMAGLLGQMQRLTQPSPEAAVDAATSRADHEAVVVTQLLKAATALARAGQGDDACTIVAGTWAALRVPRPDLAEVVNRSMHRLVRLVSQEPVAIGAKPGAAGAVSPTDADQVLDVRAMAPAQRHHTIFATYEALRAGESFVLVNDHDPKPLQYQFEAEHAGAFTWDYLERGPRVWQVRIGRVGDVLNSADAGQVLDVRTMAPAQRHQTIFATYEALHVHESFQLVNDHDPKPLQYQFEAEHAGAFTWDYLERGPRVWRVRIGRVAI